jgi:hypothetical protein
MGRYKTLIGPRLRGRGFAAQQTEAAIGVAVLNRMSAAGRPDSVRRQPVTAQQLGTGSHLAPDRPSVGVDGPTASSASIGLSTTKTGAARDAV